MPEDWKIKMFDNVEKFILVIFTALMLSFIGLIVYCDHQDEVAQTALVKTHNHKPFMVEKSYGLTSEGCSLTKVTPYDENGDSENSVYITDCKKATWTEHVGKSTRQRESLTNEKRQ